MKSLKLVRQLVYIVLSVVGITLLPNQAQAANEYFDINNTGTGSGAANGGSYTFEASTGTGGFNTTSSGLTTATTAWVDGNNFMRFSAGSDAAANSFTVTANTNHTFAGMALQTNGGGTVTIASSGGSVMNLFSSANGQGFFVGGVSSQQLMITAPIGGDAVTPLVWQGVLSGTAGSLFLYGNNTFQGGVQLNSSAGLNFNNANSFGNGGTITWGAAASAATTFTIAAPALASDITISNPMLARNGTGTGATTNLTIGNLNSHKVTWSGGLSLVTGVASSITTNSGVVTEFSGVVSGTDSTKAFTKTGAGTLILSNAGNSYAGQTTIANGTLSAPGIGNSGSNSPLGKNGTINLGATTTVGILTYTGTGETSDKVLNLAGTTGGGTIDQSGTSLLKFTSNMTASGVGAKTLTLQGSTAGTGEIAGKIVDNGGANTTAVTKLGSGTWTLSAANTYTGATSVTAGTLAIGNNSALGGSQLTLNGGAIAASGTARTIANNAVITANSSVSGTNALTINGSFTNSGGNRVLSSTNTATTTLGGAVYLSEASGTGRTLILAGSGTSNPSYLISGNISDFNGAGTAGSIQVGNGSAATVATLTLTGNNSHSGATNLGSTGNLLNIGSATALGSSTLTANGNGSFDNTTGGALVLSNDLAQSGGSPIFLGSNDLTLGNVALSVANRSITVSAKTLTVNDVTQDVAGRNYAKNGAGKLVVKGNASYTGTTTISGGTLQIGDGGTTGTLSTSSAIVDNANLTFDRKDSLTQGIDFSSAAITGTGSLTKEGGGILTLSGANIYAGGTTVNNGKLLANNTTGSATGAGDVTVNANGTLGGTGSVAGNVFVNGGQLSPGASINHLDIGGNLSMTGGAFDYEINSTSLTADLNTVAGNLSLSAAALSATDLGSGLLAMGTKFTLINYGGTWNGGIFTGLANHSTSLTLGLNRFQIDYDSTTGGSNFGGGTYGGGVGPHFVTITAVPEASAFLTVALGGIFAVAMLRMSKRLGVSVLKA
jgi:fibronectin-binding autotransporter adhesin